MQNIHIPRLTLRNFKGHGEFTLTTTGLVTQVFGNNGLGKTTIADAYNWLLFDKDSTGKKDFDIKPLDSKGQPAHNL